MNGQQRRLAVAGGRIGVTGDSHVAPPTAGGWACPRPLPSGGAPLQRRQPLAHRRLGLERLGDLAQVMGQAPQRPFPLDFGQAP